MGMDFIVGYVFNELDRKFVKAIKGDVNKSELEKSRSYSINTQVPLNWFGEYDANKMTIESRRDIASNGSRILEVIRALKEVFAETAVGHNFSFDIYSNLSEGRFVNIVMDIRRNLKELTMEELEKIVGYPFKIVEKKEEKKSNAFNANAFVMSAIFGWNNEKEDI